jgi:hypothetical protein
VGALKYSTTSVYFGIISMIHMDSIIPFGGTQNCPRQRNGARKISAQFNFQDSRKKQCKELRFIGYPSPRQEHESQVPNKLSISTPTVQHFVLKPLQESSSLSGRESSVPSSSFAGPDFSNTKSQFTSWLKTPDSDVLDPRILESFSCSVNLRGRYFDGAANLVNCTDCQNGTDEEKCPTKLILKTVLPVQNLSNGQAPKFIYR